MEAAQYLWTLLTDQRHSFTKWALFGHTLQNSDHGGHLTSIEADPLNRHFWPKHQNFTKKVLFGGTLQDSDHVGQLTSIWT